MQHILYVFGLHALGLAGGPCDRRVGHRILLTLALWHHRHRSRRHLAALDGRELDDVGLSRSERWTECAKRIWQA